MLALSAQLIVLYTKRLMALVGVSASFMDMHGRDARNIDLR